ncbi:hypothetical protein K2X89_08620, partial [Myxococcota bacterium]|nr:hypothetical protein [Myxococcota bacterium]
MPFLAPSFTPRRESLAPLALAYFVLAVAVPGVASAQNALAAPLEALMRGASAAAQPADAANGAATPATPADALLEIESALAAAEQKRAALIRAR